VPHIVSCVIALITLPLALSALPKELMESATLSASGLVAYLAGTERIQTVHRAQAIQYRPRRQF
jgi:hypothetical protein